MHPPEIAFDATRRLAVSLADHSAENDLPHSDLERLVAALDGLADVNLAALFAALPDELNRALRDGPAESSRNADAGGS